MNKENTTNKNHFEDVYMVIQALEWVYSLLDISALIYSKTPKKNQHKQVLKQGKLYDYRYTLSS